MRSWTAGTERSVPTEPQRKELPYRKLDEGSHADDSNPDRTAIALKWRQKNAGPKVVKLPNGRRRIRRDWLDAWINEQLPTSV